MVEKLGEYQRDPVFEGKHFFETELEWAIFKIQPIGGSRTIRALSTSRAIVTDGARRYDLLNTAKSGDTTRTTT